MHIIIFLYLKQGIISFLANKNELIKEHINAFGNLERGGCFVFDVEITFPLVQSIMPRFKTRQIENFER